MIKLAKPTFRISIICIGWLVAWVSLGPHSWRHVDDYIVISDFFQSSGLKSLSFASLPEIDGNTLGITEILNIIRRDGQGSGTYPPIWNILYSSFPLIALLKFGVTPERWTTFLQGYASCLIIYMSILPCLYLLIPKIFLNSEVESNACSSYLLLTEILASFVIFGNLEIFNHSTTLMPYQLPIITSIVILNYAMFNLIAPAYEHPCLVSNVYSRLATINCPISILIALTCIQFSFISPIVLISLLTLPMLSWFSREHNSILYCLCNYRVSFNTASFTSLKDGFSMKKRLCLLFRALWLHYIPSNLSAASVNGLIIVLYYEVLRLLKEYFHKFQYLLSQGQSVGDWAAGNNHLYDFAHWIDIGDPIHALNSFLFGIIRISSYAISPTRSYQTVIGCICLAVIVLHSIFSSFKTVYSNYTLSAAVILLALLSLLALKDSLYISPSRHLMIIMPFIWLPFISFLSSIITTIYINSKLRFTCMIYGYLALAAFILIIYINALSTSNQSMKYTPSYYNHMLSLLVSSKYIDVDQAMSNIILHSSIYAKHVFPNGPQICSAETKFVRGDTIFFYSHRSDANPLVNKWKPEDQRCRYNREDLKIVTTVDLTRTADIEADSNIFNGGSSLKAYKVEYISE